MPTYEYECQKCGNRFEVFQRITDSPRKRCGKCHGPVRRLIGSGAGLLFKGSGFYATDYRSENYHKTKKAESSQAASKTESKTQSSSKPKGKSAKSGAAAS